MNGTDFLEMLDRIEKRNVNIRRLLTNARDNWGHDGRQQAYQYALALQEEAEKLTLLARLLPAYTGNPHAFSDTRAVTRQNIPVEIGFTREGWFCLSFPALLPKKEKGSADYIRASLYPAMEEFFRGKVPVRFKDCVLAYRHVYPRPTPKRAWRDHDNIEVNMVNDIVAMYVLPDDNPHYCSHFYCSEPGEEARTDVYVVPRKEFPEWMKLARGYPETGIEFDFPPPEKAEKHT